MDSPSPVPSDLVVKKGSKILGRTSGGIPGPVSRTTSRTASGLAGARPVSTVISPPRPRASRALVRRLSTHLLERVARRPRRGGRSGVSARVTAIPSLTDLPLHEQQGLLDEMVEVHGTAAARRTGARRTGGPARCGRRAGRDGGARAGPPSTCGAARAAASASSSMISMREEMIPIGIVELVGEAGGQRAERRRASRPGGPSARAPRAR